MTRGFLIAASLVACAASPLPQPIVVPVVTMRDAPPQPLAAPTPSAPACPDAMAEIPGGSFAMDRRGTVTVDRFCFDVTEVTASAYARCVDAGRCSDEGLVCEDVHTYRVAGKENHPMNCVTPEQAEGFCRANGKRLPSSMEWEWAARGGDRGTTYPWGNADPDDAQLCWRRKDTCPVRSHPGDVSPHGVFDLGGNLVEFTSTPMLSGSDPEYRGGSWAMQTASSVRAADASGVYGNDRRGDAMGFRCAADFP